MRKQNVWVSIALVTCVIALLGMSFIMAPRTGAESFAGTDSLVTELLEQAGVTPWATPLFDTGSAEIESGLFAVQAALGAGILGYALGNMRGRNVAGTQSANTVSTGPDAAAAAD